MRALCERILTVISMTNEKGIEAFLGGLQELEKLNYTFYSKPPSVLYNSPLCV